MGKAARHQYPTVALPMSGRQHVVAYTAMLMFGFPAAPLALIY